MTARAVGRGALLLILTLSAACTRETRVSVVVEAGSAGLDAVSFAVEARTGSCPTAEAYALGRAAGRSVARQTFTPGNAEAFGPIDSGRYAFIALGRRSDCTPVLFGCVERDIGAEDTLRIPVESEAWVEAQRCPMSTSCAAGACQSSGTLDGGPDASDAGSIGMACTEDSDCGPVAVTECVAMRCRPRTPTIRALTTHESNNYGPLLSLAWGGDPGDVSVYVGLTVGPAGSRAAFIEALPLSAIDAIDMLSVSSPSIDAATSDVVGLDLRSSGGNVLWTMSGESGSDRRVAWIGTLRGPGADTEASVLSSPEPTRAMGPDLMVGGSVSGGRNEPAFYVTRTLQTTPGTTSMGGVRDGMASMSAYVPMGGVIPLGAGLRGSGSLGNWLVSEQTRDGDLLLWPIVLGTSESPIPYQALTRSGSGRPTLAHMGGPAYLLASPAEDGVELRSLNCTDAARQCTPAPAIRVATDGPVAQAAITEMPGAAFLAFVVEAPGGTAIRGVVLDANAEPVALAGGSSVELRALVAGTRVHQLSALTITDGGALHLIVAALVGPPAGATDLRIFDATFAP